MSFRVGKTFGRIIGIIIEAFLGSIGIAFFEEVTKLSVNPSLYGVIGIFAMITATALAVYLVMTWNKNDHRIAPCFAHLTVHEIKGKKSQKYISINIAPAKAYWLSDIFTPEINKKTMQKHSHSDTNEMKKYFEKNKIDLFERDPLPSELNLRYDENGFSMLRFSITSGSLLISKLSSYTLDDLQLIHLFPWYKTVICWGATNKKLLVKVSSKQAYFAPLNDLDFTERNIVNRQNVTFRKPLQTLDSWCKNNGYTLNRRCFSEKEFLEELERAKKESM